MIAVSGANAPWEVASAPQTPIELCDRAVGVSMAVGLDRIVPPWPIALPWMIGVAGPDVQPR
jgi:hypothetical protein